MTRKFGQFLVVGGFCTGLQYVMLVVLVEVFSFKATPASTIGYVVSSGANYYLNYRFTFKSAVPHARSAPRFAVVMGSGLLLNGAVTYLGTVVFGVNYLLAQIAASVITLLWNFMANRQWTY